MPRTHTPSVAPPSPEPTSKLIASPIFWSATLAPVNSCIPLIALVREAGQFAKPAIYASLLGGPLSSRRPPASSPSVQRRLATSPCLAPAAAEGHARGEHPFSRKLRSDSRPTVANPSPAYFCGREVLRLLIA